MKRTPMRLAAAALAAALAATAQAQNIGVTLKLMDFDVTQPAHEVYRDVAAGDRIVSIALDRAWGELSGPALNDVQDWLQKPNQLGPGMTARDIAFQLGTPGAMQLTPVGPESGRLVVAIGGNAVELTSTHPVSRGKAMDPRLRITFDLTLTVAFQMTDRPPFVRATLAELQPRNVGVSPVNAWAALGLSIDQMISSLGGGKTLEAKIRDAFAGSLIPVTNRLNAELRNQSALLALPKGYVCNGGRVEPGRLIIAAYKVLPAPIEGVAVIASWPKPLGQLMDDCAPVGIGARWQNGPRRFSGESTPPTAAAQIQNINFRTTRGDSFICSTIVLAPRGAPLTFTWADPVRVSAGTPNPMVMRNVIVARPAGWANPVVPKHPDEYMLVLAREARPGTGVQLNPAARARKSPLDPIARPGASDRIDPQARVIRQPHAPAARTAVPAVEAQSVAPARIQPGATVQLNPQPLPPKTTSAVTQAARTQPGAAVSQNPQPLPPRTDAVGSALKSRAQPAAATQAAPAVSPVR